MWSPETDETDTSTKSISGQVISTNNASPTKVIKKSQENKYTQIICTMCYLKFHSKTQIMNNTRVCYSSRKYTYRIQMKYFLWKISLYFFKILYKIWSISLGKLKEVFIKSWATALETLLYSTPTWKSFSISVLSLININ